jgi:hypothetical protein
LVGRDEVAAGLADLFPTGFLCQVAEVHETELDLDLSIVVASGVFAHRGGDYVLGFDRSIILTVGKGGIEVTNDHLFVREAPLIDRWFAG